MIHHLIEHYIQRDILRRLSRSGSLSFSNLKPDGLGNNVFAYHLKQVLHDGLVQKEGDSYSLTVEGVRYVGQVTRTNLDLHRQPTVFCLLIISNGHGEYALHRRHAQPFLGRYTFPGGLLFFGEDAAELATQQLKEKLGFVVPLMHRGTASLRLGEDGHTLSHTYAQLFSATFEGRPSVNSRDVRFSPEWLKPETLSENELLPDVLPIIHKLSTTPEYFFVDLQFD